MEDKSMELPKRKTLRRRIRKYIHYKELQAWCEGKRNNRVKSLQLLDQIVEVILDTQYLDEEIPIQIGNEQRTMGDVAYMLFQAEWCTVGALIHKIIYLRLDPSPEEIRAMLYSITGRLESYRFHRKYYREIFAKCEHEI